MICIPQLFLGGPVTPSLMKQGALARGKETLSCIPVYFFLLTSPSLTHTLRRLLAGFAATLFGAAAEGGGGAPTALAEELLEPWLALGT